MGGRVLHRPVWTVWRNRGVRLPVIPSPPDFIDERAARHIAWLHNSWLAERRKNWAGLPDLPPTEQDH